MVSMKNIGRKIDFWETFRLIAESFLVRFWSLFKVNQVKKNSKRSENGKFKLTDVHRDHPPTLAITDPASVGVKQIWIPGTRVACLARCLESFNCTSNSLFFHKKDIMSTIIFKSGRNWSDKKSVRQIMCKLIYYRILLI